MGRDREKSSFRLSVRQRVIALLVGGAAGASAGMIFFRSLWAGLVGLLSGAVMGRLLYQKHWEEKTQQELIREFRDALAALLVALRAGRSLEGAFQASLEDMDPVLMPLLYPQWQTILLSIRVGENAEDALEELSKRCEIEEIRSLARAVKISKRTEGNMVRIMENAVRVLTERMEIRMQIRALLTKKKTEQRIMSLSPLGVILMLVLLAPDYVSPLYQTMTGRLVMAVCAALCAVSALLARRMVRIDV